MERYLNKYEHLNIYHGKATLIAREDGKGWAIPGCRATRSQDVAERVAKAMDALIKGGV